MNEPAGSPAARQTSALLRRFVKPRLAPLMMGASAAQQRFDAVFAQQEAPFAQGVFGEWTPASTPGGATGTLMYLHGGGFLVGAPRLFRFVSRQFAQAGFDVFTPTYRLAPQHVFPAALDDVFAAYQALRAARPGPVALAGDSAGGGLAVALMLRLRAAGLAQPAAAALFSPWTDLSACGDSARENEAIDAFFTRKTILQGARAVLGRESARNPLASPVFADLSGLPPILAHVGRAEALRDDSTRLIARARAAGVAAQIELWPDVPHAWQLMRFIPEARQSRERAIAFLKDRMDSQRADAS
jgi:monoterpene epsilon-lactone hydrolase